MYVIGVNIWNENAIIQLELSHAHILILWPYCNENGKSVCHLTFSQSYPTGQ